MVSPKEWSVAPLNRISPYRDYQNIHQLNHFQRMRDFVALSLKCHVFIKPLLQGSEIYEEEKVEEL